MDRQKDGRLEIPPCVLQDIGPLGPLSKKKVGRKKGWKVQLEGRQEGKKEEGRNGRGERKKESVGRKGREKKERKELF